MRIGFLGDIYSEEDVSNVEIDPNLKSVLTDCEYIFCNLEGTILKEAHQFPEWKKAGPHLNQHHSILSLLKDLKITHASLANNHIFDFGKLGLEVTKNELYKNSIHSFGAGDIDSVYEPILLESFDLKVAIFAASEAQFGCLTDTTNSRCGYGWIHSRLLKQKIKECKKNGYRIILFTHLGLEMVSFPLPEWREALKGLIDDGTDLIINTHPHVIQGKEEYLGHSVYHSLGNFYFNKNLGLKTAVWKKSLFLIINISASEIKIEEYFAEFNKNNISKIDNKENFRQLTQKLEENDYNDYIDTLLIEKWEEYYKSYYSFPQSKSLSKNFFKRKLVSLLNRLLYRPYNSVLLQHNIQIETHRYSVERILKKLNHTY